MVVVVVMEGVVVKCGAFVAVIMVGENNTDMVWWWCWKKNNRNAIVAVMGVNWENNRNVVTMLTVVDG